MVANFRYCPPVGRRRVLVALLRVALRIEFEHPVVLVHSYVHNQLRPREMIGFTNNSRFVLDSTSMLWLSSQSVICGRFELYLGWRIIGKF